MTHHHLAGRSWFGTGPHQTDERAIPMPRKTKAQIGMILAEYDAAVRDQRKAEKHANELKAEIRDLSLKDGAYGSMTFALGTGREILDQPKARDLLKLHGIEVPLTTTMAPIVVKPVIK